VIGRVAMCALLLVPAVAPACDGPPGPGGTAYTARSGDVAEVAGVGISSSLVGRVAGARRSTARAALGSLVEDTLAAEGARMAGFDRTPEVAWAMEVALARRVLQANAEEARRQGPPGIDELATVTVVQAVVRRSPSVTEARGMSAAGAVAQAVTGAHSVDEFRARARAAPQPPLPVTVEVLPPFDATGRTDEGTTIEPDLVVAAFSLHRQGETSRPFRTELGWHVLRFLERTPPVGGASSEPGELDQSVMSLRVRSRMAAILAAQRARSPIEVSGAADPLMAEAAAAAATR
jgi:hypothetical protein